MPDRLRESVDYGVLEVAWMMLKLQCDLLLQHFAASRAFLAVPLRAQPAASYMLVLSSR